MAGDRLDREANVEFYSGLLIPDLVDAHCHLELSHLRGLIPPGGGFTAFARGMVSKIEMIARYRSWVWAYMPRRSNFP